MKRIYIFLMILSVMFLGSCEQVKDWHDVTDSVPPGTVSNVTVKNINGGAWIYYTLPADDDLLGVRAEYAFEEGEELRSVFSSAFNDSILLEGYANTNEHPVKLYVMDKSQNESGPVSVTVNPLTPPVELLRQSIKIYPAFGGIYSEWENKYRNDIAITVYLKDSVGDYVVHDTYYTKENEGKYSFRNMKNLAQDMRIEVRDKWEHYATPLDTVLTPLFEEEIYGRDPVTTANIWQWYGFDDKTVLYRGDIYNQVAGSREFWRLYDGEIFQNSTWWHVTTNYLNGYIPWPDDPLYEPLPMYFTIDMARNASYSRLRYWMRSRSPYFSCPVWVSFEVWGTNEPKPLNTVGDGSQTDNLKYWTEWPEVGGTGEWRNDWVKLADCELQLPSGARVWTNTPVLTQEDREFIESGFGFDMDPVHTSEQFKYLRFVIRGQNTYGIRGEQSNIQITELKFWGAYAD
ncbi:MAG: DUF4959 domain-containing protein [Tannerella sp.]|nr:DUF4959 domain-containing protein [Tannerella sp.]